MEHEGGRSAGGPPQQGRVNSMTPRRRPMRRTGHGSRRDVSRARNAVLPCRQSIAWPLHPPPRLLGDILVEEGLTTGGRGGPGAWRGPRRPASVSARPSSPWAPSPARTCCGPWPASRISPISPATSCPSPLPILKNLSPKYLRQYAVCPVSVEGSLLTVATADPLNPLIARRSAAEHGPRGEAGGQPSPTPSPRPSIAPMRVWPRRCSGSWRAWTTTGRHDVDEDVNHLRDMAFEAPGGAPRQSPRRERHRLGAPPTSTSSPSRTPCASGTGSTASSTSRKRRPGVSRRP